MHFITGKSYPSFPCNESKPRQDLSGMRKLDIDGHYKHPGLRKYCAHLTKTQAYQIQVKCINHTGLYGLKLYKWYDLNKWEIFMCCYFQYRSEFNPDCYVKLNLQHTIFAFPVIFSPSWNITLRPQPCWTTFSSNRKLQMRTVDSPSPLLSCHVILNSTVHSYITTSPINRTSLHVVGQCTISMIGSIRIT